MSRILKINFVLLCITVISGCSSGLSSSSAYIPTIYHGYQVTPFENEFIKIENVTTDYRKNHPESSTESVRIYLKESGTLIKVRKVKSGYKPSFENTHELHVTNSATNYKDSIMSGECGRFFAYVPTRGIVCWSDGDQYGGTGVLRFDETTGKAAIRNHGKRVQVYRSRTGHPIVADQTLLIDINYDNPQRAFSGSATRYGLDKTAVGYPNLHDFRQSESREIRPEFVKSSPAHLQMATFQSNGLLKVITLNKELAHYATEENVFYVTLAPDAPKPSDFFSYSYQHGFDEDDFQIIERNLRFNRPMYLAHTLLKSHPDMANFFVLLGSNGDSVLPENAVGMIPILIDEQLIPYQNQGKAFQAVNGWLIAYPGEGDSLTWGWASPELTQFSGAVWKDVYLHDRSCEPQIVWKSPDYSNTSVGCYLLQFRDYDIHGMNSGERVNQYTKAEFATRFVHGPFIVAQGFDNSWQVYTQQVYLHDSAQANLATYDRPNNFSGAIPKASTDKEAIAVAENWLTTYQRNIEKRMEARRVVLVEHARTIQDKLRDERLRQKMARYEAERADQRKRRMEAEAIMAREGSEARAKSLQNAMSSSFTNRLRNMSSAGSSARTTQSLNTMTNRLRQAQDKGY